MRSGLCGLLMSGAAALLVGCGASVDGGSGTFVGNADLGVAIAADGNSATPGTNSTWTVTINNAGPQPAADP